MISNTEIATILREMAALYEMQSVAFKPRAYEKAALGVEESDQEMAEIYEREGIKGLLQVPGVGKGIADHIAELVTTGSLKKYQHLKKKAPVDIAALTQIPGVGPKTVQTLYKKLGIRTVDDLERAAKAGNIARLPHFGRQIELNILKGITFHTHHAGRYPLGAVYPVAVRLKQQLEDSQLFEDIEIAGSFRRRQETVGDLDMLGTARDSVKAMQFFVSLPEIAAVLQHGETKSEIHLESGLQVDLRIVPKQSWGAALQYFTGNKAHNIKLRTIAIHKGYKLSEYGVFKGKKRIAGATEEEVYEVLGLDWIPPELRNDTGEIEAALARDVPKLINYGDVQGDLQVQTKWTDGQHSIVEMAEAARALGRRYIAITDHTKSLAMTHGNDERALRRQMKEIDRLNKKLHGITILKGAEVNILKDGSLDMSNELLAQLDVVGVAVHSHFTMDEQAMTERIIRALSNPYVNIFLHPTTRIINRRGPITFNFEKIARVAKQNRVALEINAHPYRLDIHDTLIRQAKEIGVKFVISSDAHMAGELGFIHFGEAQARRGWARKADILNTRSVKDLLRYFKPRT